MEREWVVPSKDEHWMVIDRDEPMDEDDVPQEGGQAIAYVDRRSGDIVILEYGLCQGYWLGKLEHTIMVDNEPVWAFAYSLYDPEYTEEFYQSHVASLSDDQFLEALAEYEPGAGDFTAEYATEYDPSEWDVSDTLLMVSSVVDVALVRRTLEDMARKYVATL